MADALGVHASVVWVLDGFKADTVPLYVEPSTTVTTDSPLTVDMDIVALYTTVFPALAGLAARVRRYWVTSVDVMFWGAADVGHIPLRRLARHSLLGDCHEGVFAEGANFFCRSLIFSGVTRRFPQLNFAFLEGGVSWALNLLSDIIEHWEKRNADALEKNLNPDLLDVDLLDHHGHAPLARYDGFDSLTHFESLRVQRPRLSAAYRCRCVSLSPNIN